MRRIHLIALLIGLGMGTFLGLERMGFIVQAQSSPTWEAPSVHIGACYESTVLNLSQATAIQKSKFEAARCVKLSSILQNPTSVCAKTDKPSFIGQSVFSQLPALNFATVSATMADTFKYPVDLCIAGNICTFCEVAQAATPTPSPTPTPTSTPAPIVASPAGTASAAANSKLPVTGSGEVLLFSLLGAVVVIGGFVYWRKLSQQKY